MRILRSKKSLTLVEVLISISFIILILLISTAFQLYAIKLFEALRQQSINLNDAEIILDHITKNLELAFDVSTEDEGRGFYANSDNYPTSDLPIFPSPFVYSGNRWLIIRINDNNTADPTDDEFCAYHAFSLLPSGCEIRYYPSAVGSIVSDFMTLGEVGDLWFTRYPPTPLIGFPINLLHSPFRNVLSITIANGEEGSTENPRLVLQTTFVSPAMVNN